MDFYFVDYETRSKVNLPMMGSKIYAEDPSTEILMVAAALGHAEPEILPTVGRAPLGARIVSWGEFDYKIYRALEDPDYPRCEWIDASAIARYIGMPGGLDAFARAMSLTDEKLASGSSLIKKYCHPNADGEFEPLLGDDLLAMREYAKQDVRVLQKAWKILVSVWPEWEEHCRRGYEVTERMNDRGVPIDRECVIEARRQCKIHEARLVEESVALCGLRPTQNVALAEYFGMESIAKGKLEEVRFKDASMDRVRQIRLESAKAATKKLIPMDHMSSRTGRAYGCFVFNGAHTGRGASRDIQFQNMVKAEVNPEVFRRLKAGEQLDNPLGDVQQNIRGFIRSPHSALAVADYSQVEARIVAWLAQCVPMLDAFRAGEDVYRQFAGRAYGCAPDDVTSKQRSYGKIIVLGRGYGAGGRALATQARGYGIDMTEAEGAQLGKDYCEAYPEVPQLWDSLEFAAIDVVRGDYTYKEVGPIKFAVNARRSVLFIYLPSGRKLRFFDPRIVRDRYDNEAVSVRTKHGRRTIWGGHWLENIAQAIATDLKLDAMDRMDRLDFEIIGEVHDEIIVEVFTEFKAKSALEEMIEIMESPPREWAPKELIRAEGSVMDRYSK